MSELPDAARLRACVSGVLQRRLGVEPNSHSDDTIDTGLEESAAFVDENSPLFTHLTHGLAYTTGSALGSSPPLADACLAAYCTPNRVGLTAGARAWSKHCHRSESASPAPGDGAAAAAARSAGWWGRAKGPVATINAGALALFWRVVGGATWRNLHWLPHEVLVYEVRVAAGYGMRWSQDQAAAGRGEDAPWVFRGFLEPQMENGHEVGWRHPVSDAD